MGLGLENLVLMMVLMTTCGCDICCPIHRNYHSTPAGPRHTCIDEHVSPKSYYPLWERVLSSLAANILSKTKESPEETRMLSPALEGPSEATRELWEYGEACNGV